MGLIGHNWKDENDDYERPIGPMSSWVSGEECPLSCGCKKTSYNNMEELTVTRKLPSNHKIESIRTHFGR